MAHSPLTKSIVQALGPVGQGQMRTERRQLLWRFVLAFGVITSTVAAATILARWMRLA